MLVSKLFGKSTQKLWFFFVACVVFCNKAPFIREMGYNGNIMAVILETSVCRSCQKLLVC